MNSVNALIKKKPYAIAAGVALCALLGATLACGQGGQNSKAPAAPTNAPAQQSQPTAAPAQQTEAPAAATEAAQPTAAPAQPTAAPTQPTVAPQPTQAVQQSDTQGDEIEQLLDQLDRQNQKDDPLTDVPQ